MSLRIAGLNSELLLPVWSEELNKAEHIISACEDPGEWNLQSVVLNKAVDLNLGIDNIEKSKSVHRIIIQGSFLHVIDDFGFYEVSRFEKHCFTWLREAMDMLQHFIIFFPCIHASVTPCRSSTSTRHMHRITTILIGF